MSCFASLLSTSYRLRSTSGSASIWRILSSFASKPSVAFSKCSLAYSCRCGHIPLPHSIDGSQITLLCKLSERIHSALDIDQAAEARCLLCTSSQIALYLRALSYWDSSACPAACITNSRLSRVNSIDYPCRPDSSRGCFCPFEALLKAALKRLSSIICLYWPCN